MTRELNSAFTRTLVDEWVRGGVTDVVISPGSRSAPLVYAVAADGRLARHIVLDERAAAFVAVGLGRATGRPAVVVTTSGTAAANLHPAVLEAHHGFVPLIVCTADRPPVLRGTGAPQTIDQRNLFGPAARWFVDVPVPSHDPDSGDTWRTLGARSVLEATGVRPGPVHLNLAFAEPLVPADGTGPVPAGRDGSAPWVDGPTRDTRRLSPDAVDALADRIAGRPRGLLIAGGGHGVAPSVVERFAAATGWPIVADLVSGLGPVSGAVPRVEALMRDPRFLAGHTPDLALRIGAPITSTTVIRGLEGARTETLLLDPDARWSEPVYAASTVVAADPGWLLGELADRAEMRGRPDPAWRTSWEQANAAATAAVDATLDTWPECSEPRAARDVVRTLPFGASLVVASSMPVRDVEWFGSPREDITVFANRGVNGIDGFVATAVGVACGRARPVVAFCGDLSFLHDGGGRLAAVSSAPNLVIVVVDNNGGGIFSFLPQAEGPDGFEELFGTPPDVDLAALARAHGFATTVVDAPESVAGAVTAAIAGHEPSVVIVRTDRARNVEHHAEVWAAVAEAISAS
ncbi:MAG: 2-succinyl-5-enolpyruvyl-6-hydroxy-3-cyclohexene-1-carboxylic-acid synthase [Acidimicrobiia bacterium]|nr:2-succinyl-5-enolpyruvyl-6-hydroxy-3-cyclohexene-1-carboxylic-acid synthase [Acidimicrobiia bacterium]